MSLKLIKSLYFLQGINEKVIDSLQKFATENKYRFSDTVFDWNARVENFYILQEGEVKLQKRAQPSSLSDVSYAEHPGAMTDDKMALKILPVVAKSLFHTNKYVEIAIRTARQPFGEEYFYLKQPTDYRAVVSSERASTIEIPFKVLESTLHTFAFFNSVIKEYILGHHHQNLEWREAVEKRFDRVKESLPTASQAVSNKFKAKMDEIMGREIPVSTRAANVLIK